MSKKLRKQRQFKPMDKRELRRPPSPQEIKQQCDNHWIEMLHNDLLPILDNVLKIEVMLTRIEQFAFGNLELLSYDLINDLTGISGELVARANAPLPDRIKDRVTAYVVGIKAYLGNNGQPGDSGAKLRKAIGKYCDDNDLPSMEGVFSQWLTVGRPGGVSPWKQWLRGEWSQIELEYAGIEATEVKLMILDQYAPYGDTGKRIVADDLGKDQKEAIKRLMNGKSNAAKFRDNLLNR
jgi:hypothetical protein